MHYCVPATDMLLCQSHGQGRDRELVHWTQYESMAQLMHVLHVLYGSQAINEWMELVWDVGSESGQATRNETQIELARARFSMKVRGKRGMLRIGKWRIE